MTGEPPYEGYRFEYSQVEGGGSVAVTHYLAIEQSHEAAVTKIIAMTGGVPSDVRLVAHGADTLNEARRRGVGNGQVSAI